MMMTSEQNEAETLQQPRVKARGHLALIEWEEAQVAEREPVTELADPVRRSPLDRLYSSGLLVLLITTCIAVAASLAH